MERERAVKKQQAEREAAEKAAEAKKNARKDEPWLTEGIVVKVSLPLIKGCKTTIHHAMILLSPA